MGSNVSVDLEHLKNRNLDYLKEIDEFSIDQLIRVSVFKGDIEYLKFLHENDFFKNDHIQVLFENVIMNDNLECLIFLHEIGYQLNESYLYNSFTHNSLECMKYLIGNNCPYKLREILSFIDSSNSRFEIFKCLHDVNFFDDEIKKKLCNMAAVAGNDDLLKFYHENGYNWDGSILKMCIMKYKGAKYSSVNVYKIPLVITFKYLNCITYLLENNCPINLEDEIYQDEEIQEIIQRIKN